MKKKNSNPEYHLCLQIANYLRYKYPSVLYQFDLSSGGKLSIGQAVKNKKLNKWRGMPDLFIFAARKGWHGMALEIKADEPAKTPHLREQYVRLAELSSAGYYSSMTCNLSDALHEIDDYFKNN